MQTAKWSVTKQWEPPTETVADNTIKKILHKLVQKVKNPEKEITEIVKTVLLEAVDTTAKIVSMMG